MNMTGTDEKLKELANLTKEKHEEGEELLDAFISFLRREKEGDIDIKVLLKLLEDQEYFSALITLMSAREATSEEDKERILREKLRSRAKSSREDVEAGRTLSLEEVKERTGKFIRERYDG